MARPRRRAGLPNPRGLPDSRKASAAATRSDVPPNRVPTPSDTASSALAAFNRCFGDLRVYALITVVVAGPYLAYLAYLWLHLHSGLLRPPVSDAGVRQLLVVGTQSSGTVQLAAELQALGLEVEHEHSDTRWGFCRDGTVSWMHGLRFLSEAPSNDSIPQLCSRWFENTGLHPAMFRSPRRGCSYRSTWSKCWAQECVDILTAEWGCAWRRDCETPYQQQLLAVRHPLRTVESLAAKFCLDFAGNLERAHPYLNLFARSMFPGTPLTPQTSNCLQVVGWYHLAYVEAMLHAYNESVLQGIFQVEKNGACDVARLAGFLNESAVVYRPSGMAARAACSSSNLKHADSPVLNQRNKGRVQLRFEDLGGGELEQRFVEVARKLGY